MSHKWISIIISTVVCAPLFYLMMTRFDSFRLEESLPKVAVTFIYIGISIVVSFVIALLISIFSKSVKNQNEMEDELKNNGLSDRFVEVAQQELNRYPTANSLKTYHFKYLLLLTVAYCRRNRIQDALNTINRIDPQLILKRLGASSMAEIYSLQYYDAQVCICETMDDIGRLDNVMNAGKRWFDETAGKSVNHKLLLDEIYSVYYAMHGEYAQAMKFADHSIGIGGRLPSLCGHLYKAKIYARMGDAENANAMVSKAYEFAKNQVDIQELEDVKKFISKYTQI